MDLLEVEGDLVIAAVTGEFDTMSIFDGPADPGFAHGDLAIAGDQCLVVVLPVDLEFVEPCQQCSEAEQHEGGQQIKAETETGFDGSHAMARRRFFFFNPSKRIS